MPLRARLVLMVGLSVSLGILAVAAVLSVLAWRSILAQAESEGLVIARLLAQGVAASEQVVAEVGGLLDREMVAHGVLTAHLADLAEEARVSDTALSRRLMEIAARTAIDEIWIVGQDGTLRAGSADDIDTHDNAADLVGLPRSALRPLLDGTAFAASLGVGQRALGGTEVNYVGVRGADTPRAVLVGREQRHIEHLAQTLGVPRLLDTLLRDEAVEAVWVFDARGQEIASRLATGQRRDRPALSLREGELVRDALAGMRPTAILSAGAITVAAAMPDAYGLAAGVALARLSSAPLDALIRDYLRIGGTVAAAVLAVGIILSVITGRRIAAPMVSIAGAAAAVDDHSYRFGSLLRIARRRDELGHLARTFETMARDVMTREEELERQVRERTAELVVKNTELDQAKQRLEADLELARLLQSSILPQAFPSGRGWNGSALMAPALQMAGDFYDHFALDAHRTGLVIADVSGKGVAPAFFMAVSRAAMREATRIHDDPGACLAAANDRLCDQNPLDMFVTVFYAVIDSRDGSVTYANGGHNPPYVVGLDGTPRALPLTGDMALGVMDGLPYASGRITLKPHETLFLFTDGVSEAMDPDGNEFGEARLQAVLSATAGRPVEAILTAMTDAVRAFAAGAAQSDDITCLVVRYLGDPHPDDPQRGDPVGADPAGMPMALPAA